MKQSIPRWLSFVFVAGLASACSSKSSNPTDGGGGNSAVAPPETCPASMTDCGPAGKDFFDPDKVAELRITIEDAEVQAAVADARAQGLLDASPHDWIDLLWSRWGVCTDIADLPVKIQYKSPDGVGDAVLYDVGMRFRGTKSRGVNVLQGFKLDINKLLPDPDPVAGAGSRQFGGVNTINALSIEGDNSLLLQCAAYKVMRDSGLPTPRCNHLSVYINGQYYGLMQSVESVHTGSFLKHAFDDKTGDLYACSAGCLYKDSFADLKYISDSFTDYLNPPKYETSGVADPLNGPNATLIPMLKCGDATTTPDPEAFKKCIQEWIDVPEWLRLMAGESLLPTLESFLGALRNYYLYFKPDVTAPHGGRFELYSWDYDVAFNKQQVYPTSGDPFTSVTQWFFPSQRAKLAQRLTKEFKADYCEAMYSFLDKAYKPETIDKIARPLQPIVANTALQSSTWPLRKTVPCDGAGDVSGAGGASAMVCKGEPLSLEGWLHEVGMIRDFIVSNKAKMTDAVTAACGPRVPPTPTPDAAVAP